MTMKSKKQKNSIKYCCHWEFITGYFQVNRSDRNTYCTVSGGNFVYSFSFLKNWSIQSYSVTYACASLTSWLQRVLIYDNIYIKHYFAWDVRFRVLKLQTPFSQNIPFICCDIFSQVIVVCLHLKYVWLGFNIHHHLPF